MKKSLLPLFLSAAPLFAGTPAPTPEAPSGPGWSLDLESLSLRAFQGGNSFSDENYDFAGRASLAYRFNNNLFTRLAVFGYFPGGRTDTFTGFSDDLGGPALFHEQFNMRASYVDWTVGRDFKPAPDLDLAPSLGLRWATFDENLRKHVDDGMGGLHVHHEQASYDGYGLVAGLDGTCALGHGFSLYGTLKASLLFGPGDYSLKEGMVMPGMPTTNSRESNNDGQWVSISELGLGVQYDFSFQHVAANVRAGLEGQLWTGLDNSHSEMPLSNNNELVGLVLGASFRF